MMIKIGETAFSAPYKKDRLSTEKAKPKRAISMVTINEIILLLSPDILKNAINTINSNTGIIARISVIILNFK